MTFQNDDLARRQLEDADDDSGSDYGPLNPSKKPRKRLASRKSNHKQQGQAASLSPPFSPEAHVVHRVHGEHTHFTPGYAAEMNPYGSAVNFIAPPRAARKSITNDAKDEKGRHWSGIRGFRPCMGGSFGFFVFRAQTCACRHVDQASSCTAWPFLLCIP